jgi:hypothetical protein
MSFSTTLVFVSTSFFVYRNHHDPFVIIFSEMHNRDVVYAASRIIEGPMELCFLSWDVDGFGGRTSILYHIRLSIEGIPQFAWCQEIANKILCDEAMIHHVEEGTRRRLDHRLYQCWAFSKDPSRIP